MFRVNVDVTRKLVEEAAGWPARAFVLTGSGSEYALDDASEPVTESHPLETAELYGASKAAGTISALASAHAHGLPLAVARLFGVYGLGEAPHRLLPSLAAGLRTGNRVPLSNGTQRRDFLFVDDVVDALLALAAAVEKDRSQIVVNVGTGEPVSVRAFARQVASELGASPDLLGFGDLPRRPKDAELFSGCPELMRAYTGWLPKVDIATGIRQVLGLGETGDQCRP